MMARAVEQISPLAGVQIEEDAGHDNDALLETGLEEVQPVGDGVGETLEIQPQVEGRVRHGLDVEAHPEETGDYVVAFVLVVLVLVSACGMGGEDGVGESGKGGKGRTLKCLCKAFISARTLSGSSMGMAASWKGTLAPPSR